MRHKLNITVKSLSLLSLKNVQEILYNGFVTDMIVLFKFLPVFFDATVKSLGKVPVLIMVSELDTE